MATKKFTVDILSKSSVEQLKKDLEAYRNDLPRKCALISQRLAELGVEVAKSSVVDLDAVFTGELYNSIHIENRQSNKNSVVLAVVADSKHAIYVEMGTGMVGAESPYPGKLPVVYGQGKHIKEAEEDIYVKGNLFVRKGEYYWNYIGEDGKLHITKGMPSRPFMYFATMEIYKQVTKIVREVFA